MSDPIIEASTSGWIAQHREKYLQDGAAGHLWDSTFAGGPGPLPTLLLTTVGAKSGQASVMPLLYGKVDGGYAIIASKGGDPKHPGWFHNLNKQAECTVQVATQVSQVGQSADFLAAGAAMGGLYARLRTDCRLVGRGASGTLLAAYLGDGEQMLDFRTFQDHAAPDTTSELLFKGALADHSRSVYTGLIRVRPDARGTVAFQTNRNLKLSEHAWAESVPNLEIENNDVKCSHASAVGPVDPEQRFYLESRGVPTAEAEKLIVAGFFDDVLGRFPDQAVADHIRDEIAGTLEMA